MLRLLHIENIAVIEKADIEFEPGLNVLTGETGAGKSIIIDALSAVTGGRVLREIVRSGAETALVTAVFDAGTLEADILSELCDATVDDLDDGMFLTRKITRDGKSTCKIGGAPLSASQLRELGTVLLDIHGQNDGRKLLDEGAHLSYLDAFGGFAALRGAYREAFEAIREKSAEIERLSMDEREKERMTDSLKHQIEELERAAIKPGERETLTARREILKNASKLTDAVESAFEQLYGGDDSDGAAALLSGASGVLERAGQYSEALNTLSERLKEAQYTVQDIAEELRDIRTELDFTPSELDELEARLDVLRRIERKYGTELEALEHLERSKNELMELEDSSDRLVKLENELQKLVSDAQNKAKTLSEKRKAAAKTLEKRIMAELYELNMPSVKFVAEFTEAGGEYGLNGSGSDEVRFLMSANAGEEPGRISRIASGGELSRIMLALKNVLGQDTGTVVFDEIDAGVSGVAAQRVGEKLAKLASSRQVLCVTHLPQLAVMADAHYEITKSVKGGRTYTRVEKLDFEGRKRELARLSGGENITITTLTSAAEQLAAAEEYKSRLKTH